ncbi:hypothetical protein D3C84_1146090 [compost metagenome]
MIGPPISTAIIPPRTIPINTKFPVPRPFNHAVKPSFNAFTGSTITYNITIPVIKIPNKGYNNTGLMPSNDCGKPLNAFFNRTTT